MDFCDVKKNLENELDDDEEYDDVFFGPVTLREELKTKNIRSRKTEIHLVKFRESLLLFRKQVNSESSDEDDKLNALDEDDNLEAKEGDSLEAKDEELNREKDNTVEFRQNEKEEIVESSYAETTYYSCMQNRESQDYKDVESKMSSLSSEFESCVDIDSHSSNLVFLGAMDLDQKTLELFEDGDVIVSEVPNDYDDFSANNGEEICEFENERGARNCRTSLFANSPVADAVNVNEPSSVNVKQMNSDNQLMEENKENFQSQSCQTSFIENPPVIKNSKLTSPSSQVFKIPLKIEPERATHSCQTSFFVNPTAIENATVNVPSPPLFKTPLSVKKPVNSVSKLPKYTPPPFSFKNSPSPTFKVPKSSPRSAKRFEHIVSPISQYINEAPPPPLIVNIRPEGNKQRKVAQSNSNYSLRRRPSTKTHSKSEKSAGSKTSLVSDESIVERFGLTIDDFNKIEDKSLKQAIKNYIRKERLSNSANLTTKSDEGSLNSMIPVANYKGPTALAAVPVRKELDLLTKIITRKNCKIPLATPRPVVMKHTGVRKKIQWAKDVSSQKKACHLKEAVSCPVILSLPERLDESRMGNDRSMVEVSMVEISSPSRTNTLFKK